MEDPVRRALQARHVEERAGPLLREGQGFDLARADLRDELKHAEVASPLRPNGPLNVARQLHLADLHERGEVDLDSNRR